MALFGKQPINTEAQAKAKTDQERLASGGLPLGAERRLTELRQNGRFFTSNLSVNELALTASEGLRPLGQVMGSTVYHVGWQYTPMYASHELTTISEAQSHARHLAVSRLQQEARLLGASGVIGVRLERKSYDWGANLIEFAASGTAVALPDDASPPKNPFVCALSGQEFYALRRGGFFPVGFAFGTCTYYHVATQTNRWASQSWNNVELTDYSKAVYHARRSAMSRLSKDAAHVHAEGIVGVTIDKYITTSEVEVNDQPRRDLIVEFTALGTAIVAEGPDTLTIDYGLMLGDVPGL